MLIHVSLKFNRSILIRLFLWQETALASGYYELLSVLHLLGMLALQEANLCLTPRPSADGFNPKASEGMCFALHPVFTFGRYISASLSWYSLTDGNSY